MAEYIEREKAKELFYNGHTIQSLCERGANTLGEAFSIILDEVPAADVRPVVLCRDCEMASPCSDDRELYCTLNHCYKKKSYFCADGKGKK